MPITRSERKGNRNAVEDPRPGTRNRARKPSSPGSISTTSEIASVLKRKAAPVVIRHGKKSATGTSVSGLSFLAIAAGRDGGSVTSNTTPNTSAVGNVAKKITPPNRPFDFYSNQEESSDSEEYSDRHQSKRQSTQSQVNTETMPDTFDKELCPTSVPYPELGRIGRVIPAKAGVADSVSNSTLTGSRHTDAVSNSFSAYQEMMKEKGYIQSRRDDSSRVSKIGREVVYEYIKFVTIANVSKFEYGGIVMRIVAKEMNVPVDVLTNEWWAEMVSCVKKGIGIRRNGVRSAVRVAVKGTCYIHGSVL